MLRSWAKYSTFSSFSYSVGSHEDHREIKLIPIVVRHSVHNAQKEIVIYQRLKDCQSTGAPGERTVLGMSPVE